MTFLTPTQIWSLQSNSSCYPMLAKQLGAACPPLCYGSQHHGVLGRKHSWLSLLIDDHLQIRVRSSPTETTTMFLVSCFKQQLLVSAGRLHQVGFANKATNDTPVEGFYRALWFWVFNNHVWNTMSCKSSWIQGARNGLVGEGKPFLWNYHHLLKGHKSHQNMRSEKISITL